jgi:hypothetical protein
MAASAASVTSLTLPSDAADADSATLPRDGADNEKGAAGAAP